VIIFFKNGKIWVKCTIAMAISSRITTAMPLLILMERGICEWKESEREQEIRYSFGGQPFFLFLSLFFPPRLYSALHSVLIAELTSYTTIGSTVITIAFGDGSKTVEAPGTYISNGTLNFFWSENVCQ
jgi:hypothetical protein